jgi:ABC-type nitrate/sulfonate/bicarbonate transport system substrate-binding protein
MRRLTLALVLAATAIIAAGCGSASRHATAARHDVTLVLDFTPNAVHTGIYVAIARHYDHREHLRLHVIAPSASTDSIKLLETDRVDFAILDIHDLAIARERGADIVGVMAIVEKPLSAVIAAPSIRTPRQLAHATVGVTGLPSDTAVLDSIVAGAGGNPRQVRTVTIGFNAVPALLTGRVAAATAFWNDEGITLARQRPGFHSFRVDDFGAPPYPELVLCTTLHTLHHQRRLVRLLVRTIERGYAFTLAQPARAAAELESEVPGLDPALVSTQLTALLPAFKAPDGRIGELSSTTLTAWAGWEVRFGIVAHRPDPRALFVTSSG